MLAVNPITHSWRDSHTDNVRYRDSERWRCIWRRGRRPEEEPAVITDRKRSIFLLVGRCRARHDSEEGKVSAAWEILGRDVVMNRGESLPTNCYTAGHEIVKTLPSISFGTVGSLLLCDTMTTV